MTSTIISGTPQKVAAQIARLHYEKVEAIVLPCVSDGRTAAGYPQIGPDEDIFAEMAVHTAHAPNADDSREAIYTRKPGE